VSLLRLAFQSKNMKCRAGELLKYKGRYAVNVVNVSTTSPIGFVIPFLLLLRSDTYIGPDVNEVHLRTFRDSVGT